MYPYKTRPISDRSQFTGKHRYSPFDSSWSSTLEVLDRELRMLAAKDVVMELDLQENQIRIDGGVKGNAKTSSPAVAVAFTSKGSPIRFATDRFHSWQDNVRAIALGMEALRKIERYGIANSDQQYTGWRQIESRRAGAVPTDGMSRETAEQMLLAYADNALERPQSKDEWMGVYALAKRKTHPDTGRERKHWDAVESAAAVLGLVS